MMEKFRKIKEKIEKKTAVFINILKTFFAVALLYNFLLKVNTVRQRINFN